MGVVGNQGLLVINMHVLKMTTFMLQPEPSKDLPDLPAELTLPWVRT